MTRRKLLRSTIAAGGTAALAGIPITLLAQGEELDEANAQAAALGYKQDATTVDAQQYPQRSEDQFCNNCQLFQGAEGEDLGGCGIFPGKMVNANGWCTAWVRKAG